LSDGDFGSLGEYFMGQMMGGSHFAMNQMMVAAMGEDGEEQMHSVMGKRLSGCDTSAAFPLQSVGFMPMMQMMMGGWSPSSNFNVMNNPMMNFGYGFGFFGWLFMLVWWALIVVALIALVKWLANQFNGGSSGKSAMDILERRYAKGEINKKEFEEKKKELT
jgi:putative membrane protein